MRSNSNKRNKILVITLCTFILAVASFFIYNFLVSYITLADSDDAIWDGETVSISFKKGNGTEENPYLIYNGADFYYFKTLIEGNDHQLYEDKYYKLAEDIDLGDHDFSTIGIIHNDESNIFKGHLNGDGHSIKNANITLNTNSTDNTYGLFTKLDGAEVANIKIENIKIIPTETNSYNIGILSGIIEENSVIKNVLVSNSSIIMTNTEYIENLTVAHLATEIKENCSIKNIYLDVEITSNYDDGIYNIVKNYDSNLENILYINYESNYTPLETKEGLINTIYIASLTNTLQLNGLSEDTILDSFNSSSDDYYWDIVDGNIYFDKKNASTQMINTPVSFAFDTTTITLHDSGIDRTNGIMYVNDLTSDLDYYTGLNYTTTSDGSIPTGESNNSYSEATNLAKIYIQYDGASVINSNYVGYIGVSSDELISKINYYKYYPVVDGKVTIELIDNPYAKRPSSMYFHGWSSANEGVYIWYDNEIHTYFAEVEVSNISSPISLVFNAIWRSEGKYVSVGNSWTNLDSLDTDGFKEFGVSRQYEDVRPYYLKKTTNWGNSFPSGAVSSDGSSLSGTCGSWSNFSSCTYYIHPTQSTYVVGTTYYELLNGQMVVRTILEVEIYSYDYSQSATGYYEKVILSNNQSFTKLYDSTGKYYASGTCTSQTCTYYRRIQYLDSEGNVINFAPDTIYYYYVTRDTNIGYMNDSISSNLKNTVKVTLTGISNSGSLSTSGRININRYYISAGNDLRIEYVTINSGKNVSSTENNMVSSSNTSRMIYGNYHNMKIGRGIKRNNNYVNADSLLGGNNSSTSVGNNNAPKRYKLVLESGYYNVTSLSTGTSSSEKILYINAEQTFGSDYDRVDTASDKNSRLLISTTAAGSWSGKIYGRDNSDTAVSLTSIVKSGSLGTTKKHYTMGLYVGGLSGGDIYSVRKAIIEGGYVYNLIGGPLSSSSRKDLNEVYANIKGGTIDFVFGGAGKSETYGNRIINITGGTITHAVFGGSNGCEGNDTGKNAKGTLTGSTFIYVGGAAIVGDGNGTTADDDYDVPVGSVFGIGNGRSSSNKIGTAKKSYILINGGTINGNVYGGGNYGSVGIENSSTTSSTIKMLNGTVTGNIFGGGNRNGSGADNVSSTVTIDVSGGTIGGIYGGSNESGEIFGNTNINISGGTINNVFGAGKGGVVKTNGGSITSYGTFVRNNVNINITGGTITNNVYGGSELGTSNGTLVTSNNTKTITATENAQTNVTVTAGTVNNSVFGGAKGDSSTSPNIFGDITVTINGGSIGKVFGGNDVSGSPAGNTIVYLNDGTIGEGYGGGNKTDHPTTNIYLQGATVTNLFGGSNESGIIYESNVNVTSGIVGNIFGGNNKGGSTDDSKVIVSGGTITGDIYGGGNEALAYFTDVQASGVNPRDIYGGCKKESAMTTSLLLTGVNCRYVFGGSNESGTVNTSSMTVNGGIFTSIYGGNNAGGTTITTNLNINNATSSYIYGGGDSATTTTSNVQINNGNYTEVYGGGNSAGVTTTNINTTEGNITSMYGGSNHSGAITTANVTLGTPVTYEELIDVDITANAYQRTWQATSFNTIIDVSVTLTNTTNQDINEWLIELCFPNDAEVLNNWSNSIVTINNGISQINQRNAYYDGIVTIPANGTYTFQFTAVTNTNPSDVTVISKVLSPVNIIISDKVINVTNLFGGNNAGGSTEKTVIRVDQSTVGTLFGGGNNANADNTDIIVNDSTFTTIYGGGNSANIMEKTFLDINTCSISGSVFGGGNYGEVRQDTEVYVTDTSITGSLYAGGNGSSATVTGNTTVNVDGKTVIGTTTSRPPYAGSVFGGGNAATTGVEGQVTSTATINIVGATIYGNVYGGANTSVVHGATKVNIGTSVVTNNNLEEDDIVIKGTIFGGGESNPNGEEDRDYSFLSVIGTIDINIDGTGYLENNHRFDTYGSIFGSGNASSSRGTSTTNVKKIGTPQSPSQNISFQRINYLTIDNCVIELEGIKDRVNDYVDIEYSFNKIDSLKILNNTTLLLKRNANMLASFYSGVTTDDGLVPAAVTIDEDTGNVTKNVDNRIYMLANRNLNITTDSNATSYGPVKGMTFLGMYNSYGSGSYMYGLYDSSYNNGDSADAGSMIIGGSYVLGQHSEEHNIKIDGFYTNKLNDEYTNIVTEYIKPTPEDTNYYRWIIGISAINYDVYLVASKYSSLGTATVSLIDFSEGDTIFNIIGFNSEGLAEGVNLVDPSTVPKLATSSAIANQKFGLAIKAETREWTSYGTTKLLSAGNGTYQGDTEYKTDSNRQAPSLMFYLYHAKNISLEDDVGTVIVTLQALTPINPIEYQIQLVTITVEIATSNIDDGTNYDASITYDKKYSMPSATTVNITNKSQFTAFFSLFAVDEAFNDLYGRNNDNYHALVSSFALPVGTQITMIDYAYDEEHPRYFYYDITQSVYDRTVQQLETDSEVTYKLQDFIKMGSTSPTNTYDDASSNLNYYQSEYSVSSEEFIFIFDLKETNISGEFLNNELLFEIRTPEDRTIVSVLNIRQTIMKYSLYETSNAVLEQNVELDDYLYYDISSPVTYSTNVAYDQTGNRDVIINTNYESSSMGLNVYVYDDAGNNVSSTMLTGTNIIMEGNSYFADADGVYRIKLSNKVSNLNKIIEILPDITLPEGEYTFKFVLFASPDGLHNSSMEDVAVYEKNVILVGAGNALVVQGEDYNKVVDGYSLLNQNKTNKNLYSINVHSVFTDPNVRISIYKRDTTTDSSTDYYEVPFEDLFSNLLTNVTNTSYLTEYNYEKMLSIIPNDITNVYFYISDNTKSGTYKVCFRLYDKNQLIEEEVQYVIVSKKVETS